MLPGSEREVISRYTAEGLKEQMVKAAAGLVRMWETAMFLEEEREESVGKFEQMKAALSRAEARELKVKASYEDYQEKYKIFAQQSTELRESREQRDKA
jgi:hypothetical protein